MRDSDGGLSLISERWRAVTSAAGKQQQLAGGIHEVYGRLLAARPLRGSSIPTRTSIACSAASARPRSWAGSSPIRRPFTSACKPCGRRSVFARATNGHWPIWPTCPMHGSLGRPDALERRLPEHLKQFLHDWATHAVPQKVGTDHGSAPAGSWLSLDDVGRLARYVRDYLCSPGVFDDINRRLVRIVGLKLRDETARRHARRKYVRLFLNDIVMTPGVIDHRLPPPRLPIASSWADGPAGGPLAPEPGPGRWPPAPGPKCSIPPAMPNWPSCWLRTPKA